MLILQKARNTISEGQTVTYNVGGKWKKYKKVNGKMKYIGVAEAPKKKKKKLAIKKPIETKRTAEQERVFEKVGIDCKDAGALKYVNDQIISFERAREEDGEGGDKRNIPAYIKNIKFISSNIAKYTPNKVGLSMEQMMLHQNEHGVDYLKGMPKEILAAIKPAHDYYKAQADKIVKVKEANKHDRKIDRKQNDLRMKQADILKDYIDNNKWNIYVKKSRKKMILNFEGDGNDSSEFHKIEKEHQALEKTKKKMYQPDDEINELQKIRDKKLDIKMGIELGLTKNVDSKIKEWVDDQNMGYLIVAKDKHSYDTAIKDLKEKIEVRKDSNTLSPIVQEIQERNIKKLKTMESKEYQDLLKPLWNNKKYQAAVKDYNESYSKLNNTRNAFLAEQEKIKTQTAKNVKKLVKEKPEMEEILRSLYVSQKLNTMLYSKQKKSKDKIIITPKEARGIKTDADAQHLFTKKRAKSYKSEALGKKLLGEFAEKGDEGKTFSIKTAPAKELKMVRDKMIKNHDMREHGGFGFKIHNVFQIGDASYYKDFKKLEKEIGNTIFSYHGTSFTKASKIARGGFKLTNPTTGRMIGDGIYGAEHSSKSLQYMSEKGVTRQPGTRGVLFVCKNALGKVKIVSSNEVGDRDACNKILKQGYDTILAEKGTGGLRNKEWNSKNPNAFMPIYWIDTELTSRNDSNNELFK